MENTIDSHKNISFAYLFAIIFSVMVIFSFVLLIENIEKRITGNAIEDNTTNNNINENLEEEKLYSTDSYVMFYMIIIGVIAFIFIVSLILKSTIIRNIEREEKEKGFV